MVLRIVLSIYFFSLVFNFSAMQYIDYTVKKRLKEDFGSGKMTRMPMSLRTFRYYVIMVFCPLFNNFFTYVLLKNYDAIIDTVYKFNKVSRELNIELNEDSSKANIDEACARIMKEFEERLDDE